MLCIRIHCLPDNDSVRLNVFAAPHVLGDYRPKPGDNIRCTGHLYASPDSLVDGASWMDSPEVGSCQDEREALSRCFHAYEDHADCSIAMAAAISALVRLGWELEESLWPYACLFVARNQAGELALFAVNSFVNGLEPENRHTADSLAELKLKTESAAGRYVLDIGLDYVESAGRYEVKLLDRGGFKESLSLPSCVGRAFAPTMLHIDDGVSSERRQYPERLDEAEMAARFARCLREKDWHDFAPWLLEEMTYCSDTVGVACASKVDFLRYISSRRDWWEEIGNWQYMRLSTGRLVYGGRPRPCTILRFHEQATALTIFDDGDGLVRAMHNLDPKQYPDFEED